MVIPQLMTSAGGATTSSGVGVYLDSNSNPGAVRDAFIFYYNNVDTNWYLYRWNGPGSRMGKWSDLSQNVPLGVFADARDSLPFVHTVTGIYSAAQQRVEIKSRAYVAGGLRISFTITDGSYPGQLIKVLGFWGTGFMALPNNNMATLSNSSHGNLVNNVIYDLEADTGTEYQVTWLAETDGFANSENFKFVLYALPQ